MRIQCGHTYRTDLNTFLQLKICLVWCAGMSLGLLANRFYGDALAAYIRSSAYLVSDLYTSASSAIFPLVISAIAVFYIRPLLPVLILLEGVLTGSAIVSVSCAYGRGGIIMMPLLLFRCLVCAPVLLWFWLETCGERTDLRHSLLYCSLLTIGISALDTFIVSPFLREVMIF